MLKLLHYAPHIMTFLIIIGFGLFVIANLIKPNLDKYQKSSNVVDIKEGRGMF